MNDRQLHILRHSLGIGDDGRGRPCRNHFCTGQGSKDWDDCRILSAVGLMIDKGAMSLTGGDHLFVVTDEGRKSAINTEPLTKASKAKRRYRYWLEIREVFPDATFHDFLTRPEFAESRERAIA